ncbi:MAG: carboxylating nicotinate-nucleotide diphosphorylase [Phycisphaerales bacterium]|nr:carboxylating nicotinate-nucleotide diphosphorylase [Phycisphaerales bacterium]
MEDASLRDFNAMGLPDFASYLRETGFVRRLIELACDEDLGIPPHDWTGELMFAPDDKREVVMRSRSEGIVAGIEFLPDLVEVFDSQNQIQWESKIEDGEKIESGTELAWFSGNARVIVKLERTMLNLISRLSGIATLTNEYVSLVESTNAKVCDTRKTTPGLRVLEKYAVRCGGGTTHRMGLNDAVLIKDNHVAGMGANEFASRLQSIAKQVRDDAVDLWFVQVEVDSLEQLKSSLSADEGTVDIILLDNMSIDELNEAVDLRDVSGSSVLLEASGGITKSTIKNVATTRVDRISIGALTHQAQSLDIGLDAR